MRPLAALLLAYGLAACAIPVASDRVTEAGLQDPAPSGPEYLREYKEAHYRELGSRITDYLTGAAFLDQVRASRVLFLGDHHADRLLHDQMIATLDGIVAVGLRPVLGLESIGTEDDATLRRYLYRHIDFEDLRAAIGRRWDESWLDNPDVDSAFYRQLLRNARRDRLAVFPLEPAPRLALRQRDATIARAIRRIATQFPNRLIVVVVGHAHLLGDGHLVEQVGLPATIVGARMSRTLQDAIDPESLPQTAGYLRTDTGVLFRYDPALGMP